MPKSTSRQGVVIGADRVTNLERRRPGTRPQRPTVFIGTNGKKTERQYLTALKVCDWVRPTRIVVKFFDGAPSYVVRRAAEGRDQDDFDEAWAICDVDEFVVPTAQTEAEAADVTLVWSNPCFELWLILHLEDCRVRLDSAVKVEEKLTRLLPNWDKANVRFDDFRAGVDIAAHRAKALSQQPTDNPSTAMWKLIEKIKRQDH
jgi:RloB-like protein